MSGSGSSSAEQAPAARRKVVRIIGRLNVGGAARQACLLHQELARTFETHLIAGSLADGEEDMSYLLASERGVLRLPQMSREISFGRDSVAFWKILRFLRRERPDIVHTHTAKAGALGRLAAWLAGVRVIVHTYHGNVFHGYFGPLKSRTFLALERLLGRMSTRLIAISESQFEELGSKYRVAPRQKIALVKNGFELDHLSLVSRQDARRKFGLRADDFVIAWAGRMVPVKDVQLLGEVISRTAQNGRNGIRTSFLVAGDGPERAELESRIQGCEHVRLVGWQRDMAPVWRASDLALLTSRNEGTPTALIEAMAAGLPFVATRVGGVRDLAVPPLRELPDGMGHEAANGFLAERTPEALLACIERIAQDLEGSRRKAAAGRALVLEHFSSTRLVNQMDQLYRSLLSAHGQARSAVPPAPEQPATPTGDTV